MNGSVGRGFSRAKMAGAILLTAATSACGPSVSDHDNRIFAAAASVKLSAADLSAAYAADTGAADARYRGRVVEISGTVGSVVEVSPMFIMAGTEPLVWASLHEDTAADVLKTATKGQRITLKCFCEGLDQQVHLKSCVASDGSR